MTRWTCPWEDGSRAPRSLDPELFVLFHAALDAWPEKMRRLGVLVQRSAHLPDFESAPGHQKWCIVGRAGERGPWHGLSSPVEPNLWRR